MKATNLVTMNALIALLENGGRHGNEIYAGFGRHQDQLFLINEFNYPVGFTVDTQGGIVFNSERLKGASKFEPSHDKSAKETFKEYCEKNGFEDNIFFHTSSVEKAMTLAMMHNAANALAHANGSASEQEILDEVLESFPAQLIKLVSKTEEEVIDEDSLVSAMIAAGMTPVREQQAPIPTEPVTAQPTDLENTVKKIEALPVTQAQPVQAENHYDLLVGAADTERAEKLINILKNGDQLNNQEQELLVQLESIVGKTKARKERLTETLNDKSTIVANSVGRLLKSHLVPYGLHKRHLA